MTEEDIEEVAAVLIPVLRLDKSKKARESKKHSRRVLRTDDERFDNVYTRLVNTQEDRGIPSDRQVGGKYSELVSE